PASAMTAARIARSDIGIASSNMALIHADMDMPHAPEMRLTAFSRSGGTRTAMTFKSLGITDPPTRTTDHPGVPQPDCRIELSTPRPTPRLSECRTRRSPRPHRPRAPQLPCSYRPEPIG